MSHVRKTLEALLYEVATDTVYDNACLDQRLAYHAKLIDDMFPSEWVSILPSDNRRRLLYGGVKRFVKSAIDRLAPVICPDHKFKTAVEFWSLTMRDIGQDGWAERVLEGALEDERAHEEALKAERARPRGYDEDGNEIIDDDEIPTPPLAMARRNMEEWANARRANYVIVQERKGDNIRLKITLSNAGKWAHETCDIELMDDLADAIRKSVRAFNTRIIRAQDRLLALKRNAGDIEKENDHD